MRKMAKQDQDEFALEAPEKKGPEKKAQWVNPQRWMAQNYYYYSLPRPKAEDKASAKASAKAKKAETAKERAKKNAGNEATAENAADEKRVAKETLQGRLQRVAPEEAEAVQVAAEDTNIAATAAEMAKAVKEATEQVIEDGLVHNDGEKKANEQDADNVKEQEQEPSIATRRSKRQKQKKKVQNTKDPITK